MYLNYPIPDALKERLEEVETELGRPLRVERARRSGSIPDWDEARAYECGVSMDTAQERGITLALYYCPNHRLAAQLTFNGVSWYDALQPTAPPVAPIEACGNLIGCVEPRQVHDYLGVHRDHYYSWPTEVIDAIADAVRLSVDDEFIASFEQAARDQQRESLQQFVRATHERQLTERRALIDECRDALVAHQDSITYQVRQLREHQQMLDAMLIVQQNDAGDQVVREWDQLIAHPRVASARFAENSVEIITTDDLRLHRPDTDETRWLGAFKIDINVATMAVTLKNLNTQRGGRDHPHVSNGRPCFGGHETAFHELLGRGELYVVFELLLQYLETLNINDEYGRYGSYWFDVPDERPLEVTEEVAA